MCDLHTNTVPSPRPAPQPPPPPPIKTQQNIIGLSVRQSDRVDQQTISSAADRTRPSVAPLPSPPSLLPGDEQAGAPSQGGAQYYHPTSLTSQTPTVTTRSRHSQSKMQHSTPLLFSSTSSSFSAKQHFLCRTLFLPSLGPLDVQKYLSG